MIDIIGNVGCKTPIVNRILDSKNKKDIKSDNIDKLKVALKCNLENVSQRHGRMREPMHENSLQKSLGIMK